MSRQSTVATKAFTPPLFGKFGTRAADLFKKQYDFDNQVVVKAKTSQGVVIETRVVAPGEAPLRGVFKSTVPVQSLGTFNGEFEAEFQTVSDKASKTTYTFNKLAPGLKVKAGVTSVKPDVKGETPDFPEGNLSLEAEYSQEYANGTVGVRSNGQKTLVDVVLALGYDNLSVGGKVTADVASKSAPTDYNFGAEYNGGDYAASVVTEKKRTQLTAAYSQVVSQRQTVGATATFGLVKPTRTLTFGSTYNLDVDTNTRGYVKIDSSKETAAVGIAVTHRLLEPKVEINVASEYNVTPSTGPVAGKFGVSLTFGDF